MVEWPPTTPQLASLNISTDQDLIKKIRNLVETNKLNFHSLSVTIILELR